MKTQSLAALLTAMLAASAGAQPMPRVGPPLGHADVPPAEALATIPGIDAAQQAELRRILRERRDALEALRDKSRAAIDTQRKRDRDEAERIDDQSAERIRKLLGDDGYRRYAQWHDSHRRPGGVERDVGHRPPPGDAPAARP
ncbi:hypothetical protein [Dokdonella sp.]|jgi:hypothetical protein|uniref:hypothetical protein n=1 Tax=Dokdonella sp. TaxID=2291710 RepID=UPI002F3E3AB1